MRQSLVGVAPGEEGEVLGEDQQVVLVVAGELQEEEDYLTDKCLVMFLIVMLHHFD